MTLVGSTIMGQIREQDIAGRVGGEEFCIVLPNTQLPQARAIAERIRLRIHSREILLHNSVSLRISASLGSVVAKHQMSLTLRSCSRLPIIACIWQSRMDVIGFVRLGRAGNVRMLTFIAVLLLFGMGKFLKRMTQAYRS